MGRQCDPGGWSWAPRLLQLLPTSLLQPEDINYAPRSRCTATSARRCYSTPSRLQRLHLRLRTDWGWQVLHHDGQAGEGPAGHHPAGTCGGGAGLGRAWGGAWGGAWAGPGAGLWWRAAQRGCGPKLAGEGPKESCADGVWSEVGWAGPRAGRGLGEGGAWVRPGEGGTGPPWRAGTRKEGKPGEG